jgi:UDP-N-acetylglucosamine--N-acetylmuramyl-(pentapeptide) pyrophosphoryl-undecaprenol N-acetylglucosamine transferase
VREILRRESPVLAVGTGGYASGPALWAASGRGIPIVIQEQNAYPGFATRRLAGRAAQIHLGFPEARRYLRPGPATAVLDTGNPIVPPPAAECRRLKAEAKKDLGFDPDRPLVLVTGGSQGSVAMNEVVAAALTSGLWPKDVQLLWQTGAASYDRFRSLSAFSLQLSAFIDPMADAWSAADLVVARGGASTFADMAAWGLPSIIVPLPTSAANHQLVNGRALEAAGAAVLLEQHRLTAASLVATVGQLLSDPARMAGIASAAHARARPFAAAEIARQALQLVAKR